MVDQAPIGNDPVAVVIVALVGWIAIRLALSLLRQAGVNIDKVSTSAGWGSGDDGAHDGTWGDHSGDGGGHGGDGGGH